MTAQLQHRSLYMQSLVFEVGPCEAKQAMTKQKSCMHQQRQLSTEASQGAAPSVMG